MTNYAEHPDLAAIAHEAEAEILIADETRPEPDLDPAGGEDVLGTAELGYYEAELASLRDAASTLEEVEHPGG